MTSAPITDFHGIDYEWLSNFYSSHIKVVDRWGRTHEAPTVEHAYQADKAITMMDYDTIMRSRTPGKAKRLGRHLRMRKEFDNEKFVLMLGLLRLKFAIPDLRDRLLNTGDAMLIEGNHWHDNIWGDCQCHRCEDKFGENHLGRLLMQVRGECQ